MFDVPGNPVDVEGRKVIWQPLNVLKLGVVTGSKGSDVEAETKGEHRVARLWAGIGAPVAAQARGMLLTSKVRR